MRALLLVALVVLACKDQQCPQCEAALKSSLSGMRRAIDQYRTDHGRYPSRLDDLVPKYLRKIPVDPLTNAADWRVTTEEIVQPSTDFQTTTSAAPASVVIDVHSSAPGTDRHGVPYANY